MQVQGVSTLKDKCLQNEKGIKEEKKAYFPITAKPQRNIDPGSIKYDHVLIHCNEEQTRNYLEAELMSHKQQLYFKNDIKHKFNEPEYIC